MKKYIFLTSIVSFLCLLLVTGCTRTASKTPIAPLGASEDLPQEPIPTKTFVIPKVVISTPTPEIISTPTMKLFVATAGNSLEQESTSETIEPTIMTENGLTEEIGGITENSDETGTPFELITVTLPPSEESISQSALMPTNSPIQVISGIPNLPTISIKSVNQDISVVLLASDFPINKSYTVHMSEYSSSCSESGSDSLVGTFNSGNKTSFSLNSNIPASLQGYSPITVRMTIGEGKSFCFFFYNANY
jgi:hypothetical protein